MSFQMHGSCVVGLNFSDSGRCNEILRCRVHLNLMRCYIQHCLAMERGRTVIATAPSGQPYDPTPWKVRVWTVMAGPEL